jgi:hypothetical protein
MKEAPQGSNPEPSSPGDSTLETTTNSVPDDRFLSGAYSRILRTSIALSITATLIASFFSRLSGMGLGTGSLVACLNLVWLHQGAEMLVRRMLPAAVMPSKFWLFLSFPARYLMVIGAAYVILKSHPGMRLGFIIGLVVPVIAMMCEAGYEAFSSGNKDQP